MRKISVIIPCYNAESCIDRCMTSVVGQTMGMDALEIICIDDASTDDTWSCLQRWEQIYPDHILLVRQEVNRRQGAARNLGLSISSAEWIAYVDADDWLEPDYLEQLYTSVVQTTCDVAVCGWRSDRSDSLVYFGQGLESQKQYVTVDTKELRKQILINKSLSIAAWGKLIRRDFLVDHGIYFPEGLTYEDEYWMPLLHIYAVNLCFINKPLYHYFVNDSSVLHSENMDYLMDWLTVQSMKWADYHKRGILQEFREEMEYDLLYSTVNLLGRIIYGHDRQSFSYFRLLGEFVRKCVPDYRMNRYMEKFSKGQHMFFNMLYSSPDRALFRYFVEKMRSSIKMAD